MAVFHVIQILVVSLLVLAVSCVPIKFLCFQALRSIIARFFRYFLTTFVRKLQCLQKLGNKEILQDAATTWKLRVAILYKIIKIFLNSQINAFNFMGFLGRDGQPQARNVEDTDLDGIVQAKLFPLWNSTALYYTKNQWKNSLFPTLPSSSTTTPRPNVGQDEILTAFAALPSDFAGFNTGSEPMDPNAMSDEAGVASSIRKPGGYQLFPILILRPNQNGNQRLSLLGRLGRSFNPTEEMYGDKNEVKSEETPVIPNTMN